MARDAQVYAFGRSDAVRRRVLGHREHVVGPHAGGVDDGLRGDRDGPIRVDVVTGHGVDASRVVVANVDATYVRRDVDIEIERRRFRQRQRDAGVVASGVEVEESRDEPVGVERRQVRERLITGDLAMALPDPPTTAQVIYTKGGRVALDQCLRSDAVATEEGNEKRERPHEEGSVVEESLSFAQVLVHQTELLLLQIAQAAVDHLGGLRAGTRGNVSAVDQCDTESPRGRVERHARTGHAGADDDDVIGLMSHRFERTLALEGGHQSMLAQGRDYLERHGLPTFR
jgi:hypothetical protein